MTRATAPVAAEIIARRPPTTAMVTAMVNEANRPIFGSTPAMIENEIASGISARATTRPASTSVRQTFGSDSHSGLRPARRAAGDTAGEDKKRLPVVLGHPVRAGQGAGKDLPTGPTTAVRLRKPDEASLRAGRGDRRGLARHSARISSSTGCRRYQRGSPGGRPTADSTLTLE